MNRDETAPFTALMLQCGQPARAAEEFAAMYRAWTAGAGQTLPWEKLVSVAGGALPTLEEISGAQLEPDPLGGLAWIVLNGGLGTTMRMTQAKSLVRVRDGRTFLDLITEGAERLRQLHKASLPLIFMNSFATDADTRAALTQKKLPPQAVPRTFCQHSFPRIRLEDKMPLGDPENPENWAPPGHGDLYLALATSGLLAQLLATGHTHLFISNADNLGAYPDPAIYAHLKNTGCAFLLELTPRTGADLKGGALVTVAGVPTLLEAAMVPQGKMDEFTDPARFPAFNTNNVWLDLKELEKLLAAGRLELPVIPNRKTVGGVPVVQLEHALGAAVAHFPRSGGLLVGRSRFAPVKTVEDLLARRSDLFEEGGVAPLTPSKARPPALGVIRITLDPRHYTSVDDLDERIPRVPSLIEAASLTVRGDVRFGDNIKILGDALVENHTPSPLHLPEGLTLGTQPG